MDYRIYDSVADFAKDASAWNEMVSAANGPYLARPEMIELYVRHFLKPGEFRAITVIDEGRILAGLAYRQTRGPIAIGLGNEWVSMTGPVFAKQQPPDDVLLGMQAALREQGKVATRFDWASLDDPFVRNWAAGIKRHGWAVFEKPRYDVGWIDIPDSWEAMTESWSRNRRKKSRQWLRGLESIGQVELLHIHDQPDVLTRWWPEMLQIECSGWKGRENSAIINHPIARGYFDNWAEIAVKGQAFRAYGLLVDGQMIAYDFGYQQGDIYASWKISYRSEFARHSPGQALNALLIKYFIETQSVRRIDTIGPITDATAIWSTDRYRIGRMMTSQTQLLGNGLVTAYGTLSKIKAFVGTANSKK